MIICHVITSLWDGGAEAALFRLCTARLAPQEQHTVISLMSGGIYAKRLQEAGITVHSLDMPRGGLTIRGLVKCYRLLRALEPDVVQTWMYHADLVGGLVSAIRGGTPVVWGLRHANLDPGLHSKSTLRVVRVCAVLSHWLPTRIVSCSEAGVTVHRAAGYDRSKFVVIPNGYPMRTFAPSQTLRTTQRAALGIAKEQVVIGMAARFDPLKDHATLFAALRLLADRGVDFVCLLIGSGMSPSNERLACLLEGTGLGDRVHLLGLHEDVRGFMSAIDLHVLSSIGEGFPNVIAEAMACQTPCVTTDAGDARTIVGDEGWVVPPRDAFALASAIENALHFAASDADGWQALKLRCRSRIEERFSIQRMVSDYHSLWRDVVAGNGGSHC